jgi:hypothetical protein
MMGKSNALGETVLRQGRKKAERKARAAINRGLVESRI